MYNVKLARVTKKDGKNVCKNIQMKFIDCCRYMATRLDKLASTWIIIHSKIQPVLQGRRISPRENIHVIFLVLLKTLSTKQKKEEEKL